jgi:hypothetical protein
MPLPSPAVPCRPPPTTVLQCGASCPYNIMKTLLTLRRIRTQEDACLPWTCKLCLRDGGPEAFASAIAASLDYGDVPDRGIPCCSHVAPTYCSHVAVLLALILHCPLPDPLPSLPEMSSLSAFL